MVPARCNPRGKTVRSLWLPKKQPKCRRNGLCCAEGARDRMQLRLGLLVLLAVLVQGSPLPEDVSEYTHMTINHTHPAIECFQGTDNDLELINCPSGWCRVRAGYGTIAHMCDVHVLCEKPSDANGETGCTRDPINPSLFTCCCHESKCNSCNSEETCFQDFHGELTGH